MTSPDVRDSGALDRAQRQARRSVVTSALGTVVIVVLGWGWPGVFDGGAGTVTGLVLVALCALAVAVFGYRVRLWRIATERAAEWAGSVEALGPEWDAGVCGDPQPLPRHRHAFSLAHKEPTHPPFAVGVRTESGPLARGRAVVVYGRDDGARPRGGDAVVVLPVRRHGPYVLVRIDDGMTFVGEKWGRTAA